MTFNGISTNCKFKSIDELVENTRYETTIRSLNIFEYLIYTDLLLVRDVLRLPTNKPSKYDLLLINEINKDESINSTLDYYNWNYVTMDILLFYRNRKDHKTNDAPTSL